MNICVVGWMVVSCEAKRRVIADYKNKFSHKQVWDLTQYPCNGFGRCERTDGSLMTLKTNCANAIYSQAKMRPLDDEELHWFWSMSVYSLYVMASKHLRGSIMMGFGVESVCGGMR